MDSSCEGTAIDAEATAIDRDECELVGIGAVADLLGVAVPTVRRAAKQLGLVDSRTVGRHRRFTPEDVQQLISKLGITPKVAGLSPVEVKVLAAISRHPFGFRSVRALARAADLSPTTVTGALQKLTQHDLVLSSIETVAEGSARDVTLYRLRPEAEWAEVAPLVTLTVAPKTVAPNRTDVSSVSAKVPRRFWHLFWNVDPARLRLPEDERFVANRMMLSHDPAAWAWGARNLSKAALCFARDSRGVDGPNKARIDNLLRSSL